MMSAAKSQPVPDEEDRVAEDVVRTDPAAFERFVAAHRARVAGLAYRLTGWGDDVDDVVQEVFLSALRNMRRFRGECSLATWLAAITVNTCRNQWRRRLLRGRLFAGLARQTGTTAAAADTRALDDERFADVRRAVRALPSRYREVIVLRYLEEMSVAEVGTVLGISRSAVEVRLSRARQRLKRLVPAPVED